MDTLKRIYRSYLRYRSSLSSYLNQKNTYEKTRKRIADFFEKGELPFTDSLPTELSVGHEVTIRCNLRCKMCYQGQSRAARREELKTDEVLEVYDKIPDSVNQIKLVGGEPFVRKDILDLISFWNNKGIRVNIQSNCTLIDDKTITQLKNFDNIRRIQSSVDGPPLVHDHIRGVEGSYDRLSNSIEKIKHELENTYVNLYATLLMDENLEELTGLVDTLAQLKPSSATLILEKVNTEKDVIETYRILSDVLSWKEEDIVLNTQLRENLFPSNITPSRLRRELKKAQLYALGKGLFLIINPLDYYFNLDEYFFGQPDKIFCKKLLNNELRINEKGDVIWCDIIGKSFGNLLEKSFEEIWLSRDFQNFRKFLMNGSLPVCKRCCKTFVRK